MSDPTDYSNSHKEKSKKVEKPEKKVERIVTGEAVEKKKSFGYKIKHLFFGGDFKQAAQYVASDILLPGLRNMLADAGKGAIDRVLYGETSRSSSHSRRPEARSRVQYNHPLNRGNRVHLPDQPPHPYRQSRTEANDIIIAKRDEAEAVLEALIDISEAYDAASLADLYEMVGLPVKHTDMKWGWESLATARVTQVREGYLLELPPMVEL